MVLIALIPNPSPHSTLSTTNSSKVTVTETFLKEFTTAYEKMDDEYKWTLSTGKVVEDILYSYGSKCCYEDVSHSFIRDMACDDLVKKPHSIHSLKYLSNCSFI
ncbi:hypothetical protein BDC45DRAFT_349037 [Circinella umbellata]|nr:hypothetical protein BDC45DRAFT_349037 [Circinella umbellata]